MGRSVHFGIVDDHHEKQWPLCATPFTFCLFLQQRRSQRQWQSHVSSLDQVVGKTVTQQCGSNVLARDLRHEIHPRVAHSSCSSVDCWRPSQSASSISLWQATHIPLYVTFNEAVFGAIAYLVQYDAENIFVETSSTKHGEQPWLETMRQYLRTWTSGQLKRLEQMGGK